MRLHPFPITDLIWPTLAILVAGFALSFYFTRRPLMSYCIAAIKAGLFIVYFGFLFDGTYTFSDDWTYLQIGEKLARQHIGIFNLAGNYEYVESLIGGSNASYYVYTSSMLRLFGFGYYGPVAANIILTFLTAGFLTKAARIGLNMSDRISVGLFAFLALSPDVLAWSTIPNLKDTLVAAETAAAVYAVALVDSRKIWRAILLAAISGTALVVTRFYVPLMMAAAFGATLLLTRRGRRSPWLWLSGLIALAAIVHVLGHNSLSGAWHELRANIDNPIVGILRFIVTPIPFNSEPSYAFLDIPQVVYWLMIPFMLYGIFAVWKKAALTTHFMVIYLIFMVLLYGMYVTLQGPRHRVQINGFFIIFEYCGILAALRPKFRLMDRLGAANVDVPVSGVTSDII